MASSESKPKVFLIDGSGYIFRAFYGVRQLSNSEGIPTNATFGFTKMLLKLIKEQEPTHLAIAFDTGGKNFRHKIYSDYKANRPPAPEDLVPQFEWIHKVVDAFQIPRLTHDNVEADDILGSLAKKFSNEGWAVRIVTGDKDLMQMVSEDILLFDDLRVQRGKASTPEVSIADVVEKFGVNPDRVIDVLALAGDSSDNVPGVKGIGPKIAAELVNTFGGVEEILASAHTVKQKARRERLMEQADMARLSKELVTIDQNIDMEVSIDDTKYIGPAREKLRQIFSELDFTRLLDDPMLKSAPSKVDQPDAPSAQPELTLHQGDLFAAPAASSKDVVKERNDPQDDKEKTRQAQTDASLSEKPQLSYQIIESEEQFSALMRGITAQTDFGLWAAVDQHEAEGDIVIGIALSLRDQKSAYIPLRQTNGKTSLNAADVCSELGGLLAKEGKNVYCANSKSALVALMKDGCPLFQFRGDPVLASYLLDPDDSNHALEAVTKNRLGYTVASRDELCGTGKQKMPFADLELDNAAPFAIERAALALSLCDVMHTELQDAQLRELYDNLELPLSRSLAKLESFGVKIDVQRLNRMSKEFEERLEQIESEAYKEAGERFNLQSPSQISKLLFDKMGLKVVKRTKTGPSTDSSVLEQLRDSHPLPGQILEHRLVAKLKNTYVDVLPKLVRKSTDRVHTRLHQTVTATGRLSSSDPNLQNIPIRTAEGRSIREAFVASDGHAFVALDYSQIELRILAHVSQDPVMLESFQSGEDVHRRTASEIFETKMEEVTREQRGQAKAINFGLLYGMGVLRLARELGIKRSEAKAFLEKYFERYQGVKEWNDRALEQAHRDGMVHTLFGRRRLLPELKSANRGVVARGERLAINTPIQGTAADLIKRAMVDADASLTELAPSAKLVLQVHDELILDVPTEHAEHAFDIVKGAMEKAAQFDVPLVVDGKIASNWSAAH